MPPRLVTIGLVSHMPATMVALRGAVKGGSARRGAAASPSSRARPADPPFRHPSSTPGSRLSVIPGSTRGSRLSVIPGSTRGSAFPSSRARPVDPAFPSSRARPADPAFPSSAGSTRGSLPARGLGPWAAECRWGSPGRGPAMTESGVTRSSRHVVTPAARRAGTPATTCSPGPAAPAAPSARRLRSDADPSCACRHVRPSPRRCRVPGRCPSRCGRR